MIDEDVKVLMMTMMMMNVSDDVLNAAADNTATHSSLLPSQTVKI